MGAGPSFVFLPFRLDLANECLWCGQERRTLRSKTFAVFRALLEQPGQLVTKETLLETVWSDAYVSDAALTVCIREIRQALGDDSKTPRFIETVHRRGYRFIGDLSQPVAAEPTPTPVPPPAPTIVGRTKELERLHAWWAHAERGSRQVIFISGEPGIGKTTLVETFLGQLEGREVWIGRGQCVDHYGAGEAYLPVLEALGRLCREPHGDTVLTLLRQHAPTWLVQMPALLSGEERDQLQRQVQGATQERMLREFAEALEALTAEQPLILRLEDLHWSDYATMALLSALARRTEPARLFILGTYRPAEVLVQDHPLKELKQELALHDQCQELTLAYLSEAAIGEYVRHRFGIEVPLSGSWSAFVQAIHRRTEGNPLFMIKVVDDLVARKVISQAAEGWTLQDNTDEEALSIPATVRQLIDQQFARVSEAEQAVLEAASVVGAEFSAAAVAAAIDVEQEVVEERCDRLARRSQFLRDHGISEWPDGTIAAQYGFTHALYQEVVYERLAVSQRTRLHRRVGEREAVGYGEQTAEIAAKLAVHFEHGRAYEQAVQYYEQAGRRALQRSANAEAIGHLTKGLKILLALPDSPQRAQQELVLQTTLGPALLMIKGWASLEAQQAYTRARELCQQIGDTPEIFPTLWGVWLFYAAGGALSQAREIEDDLLQRAEHQGDADLLLQAYHAAWGSRTWLGEFTDARDLVERGLALYRPEQHHGHAMRYGGHDPGVCGQAQGALALWFLGYADQALHSCQEALRLAQEVGHPPSLAHALNWVAFLHQFRREPEVVREHTDTLISLAAEQGLGLFSVLGSVLHGWALALTGAPQDGLSQLQGGFHRIQAIGVEGFYGFFKSLMAEVYVQAGQRTQGLEELDSGLAYTEKIGDRFWEAELYRLKGELTLQSKSAGQKPVVSEAEGAKVEEEAQACFSKAIEIAQKQEAKSLELRAATSLARLWQQQGKKAEAHELLAPVYNWFTEGFDTADLQEAKVLLDELA